MNTQGSPRRLNPRSGIDPVEEFDRAARETSEAIVVNVSPFVARFEIAGTPGSPPRRYSMQPGESRHLQAGYTEGFLGAGRQPVRATIESLTEREVFPKGPRLPMVVHENRASEVQSKWRQALEDASKPVAPVEVAIPSVEGGEPVKAFVSAPSIAPSAAHVEALSAAMPQLDEEDQSGPLDEPPPEHNEPIELPKAKGKGK